MNIVKLLQGTLVGMLLGLIPLETVAQEPISLASKKSIKEDFSSLEQWVPVLFPKIPKHSKYTITTLDDGTQALKATSNSSASALGYRQRFYISDFPKLKIRWKAESIYEKGDGRKKSGDDFTLRVYVAFKYNPDNAGFVLRAKYEAAKLLHGEYPPHSTINYVWANKGKIGSTVTSPYTDRAKTIYLDVGNERLGTWREHNVNIVEDYKRAFGESPPEIASLAVMNDSDNTGEKSVSYIDFIELSADTSQ